MSISEEQLSRWAKAPSETEEGKCQATVKRITQVIENEFGNKVSVFLQGSYKNRTNVRLDSDVDIVVCYEDSYFPDDTFLSESDKRIFWDTQFVPANYRFTQFKNDIERILSDEFESGEVKRKDKCIQVKGNDYRVNADVVPCFVHNRLKTPYLSDVDVKGIEFMTDRGVRVYSFPKQHYENAVQKNLNTNSMYKPIVRIIKNIRNELVESGEISNITMPSFSIECLVWNVYPDDIFQQSTYREATKGVIKKIWNDMKEQEKADQYAEVSDLLWLFRGNCRITPKQAQDVMLLAWNYIS